MASRQLLLVLAAATSLGLAACHRGADSGATAQANAPGRPGTGNGVKLAGPEAAQPSNARASTGAEAPLGTTGKGGTSTMGGPGTGLQGGMNPQPGQPTGVAGGSTNRTTHGSVGNR